MVEIFEFEKIIKIWYGRKYLILKRKKVLNIWYKGGFFNSKQEVEKKFIFKNIFEFEKKL